MNAVRYPTDGWSSWKKSDTAASRGCASLERSRASSRNWTWRRSHSGRVGRGLQEHLHGGACDPVRRAAPGRPRQRRLHPAASRSRSRAVGLLVAAIACLPLPLDVVCPRVGERATVAGLPPAGLERGGSRNPVPPPARSQACPRHSCDWPPSEWRRSSSWLALSRAWPGSRRRASPRKTVSISAATVVSFQKVHRQEERAASTSASASRRTGKTSDGIIFQGDWTQDTGGRVPVQAGLDDRVLEGIPGQAVVRGAEGDENQLTATWRAPSRKQASRPGPGVACRRFLATKGIQGQMELSVAASRMLALYNCWAATGVAYSS